MEVQLSPKTAARLRELVSQTGRPTSELIEDAMAGYLVELAEVRKTLDRRYDQIKSGKVQPMDGDEALARLRRKSDERRSSRS